MRGLVYILKPETVVFDSDEEANATDSVFSSKLPPLNLIFSAV